MKEKPDLVFGLGGYVSFPISLASRFLNLPLVIYESNILMGRTNKYLSSFSKKILVANDIINNLPKKYQHKTFQVGPILNKSLMSGSFFIKKDDEKKFSLLVLGGFPDVYSKM